MTEPSKGSNGGKREHALWGVEMWGWKLMPATEGAAWVACWAGALWGEGVREPRAREKQLRAEQAHFVAAQADVISCVAHCGASAAMPLSSCEPLLALPSSAQQAVKAP